MKKPRLHTRLASPTDFPFIFSTYLKHRWFSKENTTTLRKDTWMKVQHQRLEKILTSQPVAVACLTDDHDTILGYALQDGSEPFQYVKLAFRVPEFQVSEALTSALTEASKLSQEQEKKP